MHIMYVGSACTATPATVCEKSTKKRKSANRSSGKSRVQGFKSLRGQILKIDQSLKKKGKNAGRGIQYDRPLETMRIIPEQVQGLGQSIETQNKAHKCALYSELNTPP